MDLPVGPAGALWPTVGLEQDARTGDLACWRLPGLDQRFEVSTLLCGQNNAMLFHGGLLVWFQTFFQGYPLFFFWSNEAWRTSRARCIAASADLSASGK